jgi:adenylate cyclase
MPTRPVTPPRQRRDRHLRAVFFLVVAAATVGLALLLYTFAVLNDFERQTLDARFSLRGARPPKNVVVVAIDNESLLRLNARFPFRRRIYAPLLDNLRRDGARLVVFDIEFNDPTDPADDLALYEAVGRAHGKVVLATSEVGPGGSTNVFGGAENLARVGARVGNAQLPNDRYAVLRRMPFSVQELKSLAVVSAEAATRRTVRRSNLGGATAWIDYAGPPKTIRFVPFWRVARGRFPAGTFRDKVVVVGASAPKLGDIHATPTSGSAVMAGVEVQANEVSTALRGFPLRSAPGYLDILLIALLGLVAPVVSIRRSPLVAGACAVGAGAAFAAAAQLAFDHGVVLSVVYGLIALATSAVLSLGLHYVLTAVERERVRDVFSRFVPEQVVDQVLAQTNADLRLGGHQSTATVMFCDLRGFTTSAERLPADQVIDLLNQYLGAMSETILAHGGTLVSYIGDGIMAVFGAPIEQPDHADRAVAAAREMVTERLPGFNEWLAEQGLGNGYKMGIGIHTGPIMSGNVGSARRLEYTAVGDTVNTASRVEGLTKGTPYSVFVADSTYTLLSSRADLVDVGEYEIRGREQTLKLWALPADAAPCPEPTAESVDRPVASETPVR